MQSNNNNPKPEMVEKVRAHVALRLDLLASCARAATGLNNAASKLAYVELRGIRDGITDIDAVQAAVCAKFPKLTANGKPSKTPNSSFRTSWDKLVLIATVLAGTNNNYDRPEAKAIAEEFISDANGTVDDTGKLVSVRMTLNDAVDRIKADKAEAGREKARNKTDEQKAAEKAAEEAALIAHYADAVSNSPAMLTALADRIAAFTVEDAAKAEAIAALREATGTFAETLASSEEQKLAA